MKNSDKKIILKFSPIAIVLELVGLVLMLLILYVTVTHYPAIQDSAPKAFSASGIITEWGSKQTALLWPIAAVYVYLVLTAASLLIRRLPDDGNHNTKISVVLVLISCARIVFLTFALISVYSTMLIQNMPSWSILILPAGIVITVLVGIGMVRNKKSSYCFAIKEAKV